MSIPKGLLKPSIGLKRMPASGAIRYLHDCPQCCQVRTLFVDLRRRLYEDLVVTCTSRDYVVGSTLRTKVGWHVGPKLLLTQHSAI